MYECFQSRETGQLLPTVTGFRSALNEQYIAANHIS
jgi:hypothetical protein